MGLGGSVPMPLAVPPGSGRRERSEYAEHFDALAQALQRLRHVGFVVAALDVGKEHVAPEPLLSRPRFDPRQVDLAVGELREAADEPARLLGAEPPEHDRGLPGAARAAGRTRAAGR